MYVIERGHISWAGTMDPELTFHLGCHARLMAPICAVVSVGWSKMPALKMKGFVFAFLKYVFFPKNTCAKEEACSISDQNTAGAPPQKKDWGADAGFLEI